MHLVWVELFVGNLSFIASEAEASGMWFNDTNIAFDVKVYGCSVAGT